MNAVDTNVLVYRLDRRDPRNGLRRATLCVNCVRNPNPPRSCGRPWRNSSINCAGGKRKAWWSRVKLLRHFTLLRLALPLTMPTPGVLDAALDLSGRFSLSHWDSMLLGAWKEAGVTTLYTEDMGSPANIDGIQLVNPF